MEYMHHPERNRAEITEKNNILLSIQRLMTYPYVVEALEAKRLEIHGWWYNVGTGELEVYDYGEKEFKKVSV